MRDTAARSISYKRIIRHLRRVAPLALMDAVILLGSYAIVYSVRTSIFNLNYAELAYFVPYTLLVTIVSLYACGAYHRLWTKTSGHDVIVLVKAIVLSTVLIAVPDFFLRPRPVPLSVILVGNAFALMGFTAVRYRSRLVSGMDWRWRAVWKQEFPRQDERALVIGAGEAGQTTVWRLKHRFHNGKSGYQIVGLIDDDPAKQNFFIEGCPVLGTREDIPAVVQKYDVDLIVVAIHNISGPDFRDILSYCEKTSARIKIVPDVLALLNGKKGATLLRDVQAEDLLGRQTVSWHEDVGKQPIVSRVIMVTGAAGSIGSELCHQILQYQPTRLILLDNNESGLHDLVTELRATSAEPDKLIPVLVDITDRPMLDLIFERYKPDVVFHSAAYKHVPMLEHYPQQAIRVNIGGTLNVAQLAQQHHVERFVLISTDKAVNPTSVMGASKRVCELIVHELGHHTSCETLFAVVRFGNVLGSRGSVVPTFTRQIEAGGPVTVTDKNMTRYFMTIPEAVNLVIHAACLTTGGQLFMLRMGEDVHITELAERMIRMRGLRPHIDIPIHFVGMRPGEKLHEELHSAHENTIPTIHPSIVQLVDQKNGHYTPSFMGRIATLMREGLDPDRSALEQLHEIVEAFYLRQTAR